MLDSCPQKVRKHHRLTLRLGVIYNFQGRCESRLVRTLASLGLHCGLFRLLLPRRYAFRMAIPAFHEVNVVLAAAILERRIHLLHINSAIRELRMARGARSPRTLSMFLVTRQATQSLMHPDRCPIVSAPNLSIRQRRVALVTKCLSHIRADLNVALAIDHLRQWKPCHRYMS